ncbi:hypothetical protein PR048_006258 [Dryococelus australis]|uniref:HAT C-terminal dimerisation domain-containing protein n=1 Tax=Dryococelus australis TaxID=614101 RepID=A0ABQ9IAG0_9NEOP|nr:hypothetical protein PR048_006258 [Dryococelus australis]
MFSNPGRVFAQNLCKALKSRFPLAERGRLYLMASAVGPRFKMGALPDDSKKEIVPGTLNEDTNTSEPKTTSISVWSWLESIPIQGIVPTTEDTGTENVNKQFVSLPRIARSESPLQWWRHNSSQFPVLSEVAKCFLAIPSTQVSSERVFSTGGNIVSSRREVLLPIHGRRQPGGSHRSVFGGYPCHTDALPTGCEAVPTLNRPATRRVMCTGTVLTNTVLSVPLHDFSAPESEVGWPVSYLGARDQSTYHRVVFLSYVSVCREVYKFVHWKGRPLQVMGSLISIPFGLSAKCRRI